MSNYLYLWVLTIKFFSITVPAILLFNNANANINNFQVQENIKEEIPEKLSLGSKKSFIKQNIDIIISTCKYKKDIVTIIKNVKVLCYHGRIIKDKNISTYNRKYSIAYINSPGGDTSFSFDLGREIYRNSTFAIIDEHCHSSCANYLLPAFRRIYITDDTVMSMHTNLPRTPNDFIRTRFPKESQDLKNKLNIDNNSKVSIKKYIELLYKYDDFFEKLVIEELRYYKYISTDIAYNSRYREVFRTLQKRKNYSCRPEKGLYLILGPEYLKEFKIKTIRDWFPNDTSEYVELLAKSKNNNSFIYDFDEHPFWISGKGLQSPQSCYD